jgi:2-polyprenyl-6-methoxyphenol hydroxylase-like FAD-dependent oxidoreductase
MSGLVGRRAMVIGAGMGGLAMAGALAPYFEQVEIFERDLLSTFPASRSGTAQDRHPHGLLAGGLQALDRAPIISRCNPTAPRPTTSTR